MKLCDHHFCRSERATELQNQKRWNEAANVQNRKVECRLIEQSTAGKPAQSEMLTGRQGRTK